MATSTSVAPEQITPIYNVDGTNAPIELGSYKTSVRSGGRKIFEDVNFKLRLLPSPRLVGEFARQPPLVCLDSGTDVEIPLLSSRFRPIESGVIATLKPSREPVDIQYTKIIRMREIVFHLVNFYDFMEAREYIPVRNGSLGHVKLQASGWIIVVHSLRTTRNLTRCLSRDGGFAITHVGRISRLRGGKFLRPAAKKMLEALRLFFSFARGSFTGCVLPLGLDENGQRQWGQWGAQHIIHPWQYSAGWFHGEPASLLEDVFPGFPRLCNHRLWRIPIRESLYLYLRANNTAGAGVDGGLILAQATLEKMAWVHCVDDKKLYSATYFASKQMPARRKIAALLQDLSIPLQIPYALRSLYNMAKKRGWQDGPEALVKVRNEVVHAQRRYPRSPFAEAWRLSQWYIELVVLRLAGHSGSYINRISARHTGDMTKVPWA